MIIYTWRCSTPLETFSANKLVVLTPSYKIPSCFIRAFPLMGSTPLETFSFDSLIDSFSSLTGSIKKRPILYVSAFRRRVKNIMLLSKAH